MIAGRHLQGALLSEICCMTNINTRTTLLKALDFLVTRLCNVVANFHTFSNFISIFRLEPSVSTKLIPIFPRSSQRKEISALTLRKLKSPMQQRFYNNLYSFCSAPVCRLLDHTTIIISSCLNVGVTTDYVNRLHNLIQTTESNNYMVCVFLKTQIQCKQNVCCNEPSNLAYLLQTLFLNPKILTE